MLNITKTRLCWLGLFVVLACCPLEALAGAGEEQAAYDAALSAIPNVRQGNVTFRIQDTQGNPIANAQVRATMTRHDFRFAHFFYGGASWTQNKRDKFQQLFNSASAHFIWGSEGSNVPQELAYYNQIGGIKDVLGHALLWKIAQQGGYPSNWDSMSDAQKRAWQQSRISSAVNTWKSQGGQLGVDHWDVVNEPYWQGSGTQYGYASTPDWVRESIRIAKAANPDATIRINEWGITMPLTSGGISRPDTTGANPFFNLMKNELSDPQFSGVQMGLQTKSIGGIRTDLDKISQTLDKYSETGKKITLTEMTVPSSGTITGSTWKNGQSWTQAEQADYAKKLWTIAFSKEMVNGICWWALADDEAHAENNAGLLNDDGTPRPAYTALQALVKQDWATDVQGNAEQDGTFGLNGFYGDYEVVVTLDGQEYKETVLFLKDGGSGQEFVITVPEPATVGLLSLGAVMVVLIRRRNPLSSD